MVRPIQHRVNEQKHEMEIVNKVYKLGPKIGSGTFGDVYIAENVNTNEKVAIKLERKINDQLMLKNEYKVYRALKGGSIFNH
jgi:serine/threonine protein kinase